MNGCYGYPNSTLSLYGKWRDLQFKFRMLQALYTAYSILSNVGRRG